MKQTNHLIAALIFSFSFFTNASQPSWVAHHIQLFHPQAKANQDILSRRTSKICSVAAVAYTGKSSGLLSSLLDFGKKLLGIKTKKPTYRSRAGNECSHQDPDLCWVNQLKKHEQVNLYQRYSQAGTTLFPPTPIRQRPGWEQQKFHELSEPAQQLLAQKFVYIENQQKQKEFKRQHKLQQEKQKRVEQQKKAAQKPTQNWFLERKEKLRSYKQTIQQEPVVWSLERLQQRQEAIQKTLSNNFSVSIKQYTLSSQATRLLQQHNIHLQQFKECVGNSIQQQIHSELVAVLNSGADLDLSGVEHLVSENFFITLGNFSCAGAHANKAGNYIVAYCLSDMCQGVYDFALSIKNLPSQIYEASKNGFAYIAQATHGLSVATKEFIVSYVHKVDDFARGVLHKAFVRPARNIATCLHLLGYGIKHCIRYAAQLETTLMIIRHEGLSENAKLEYQKFMRDYKEPMDRTIAALFTPSRKTTVENLRQLKEFEKIKVALEDDPDSVDLAQHLESLITFNLPLKRHVDKMVDAFMRLPNKEKAQEISAFALQFGVSKGVGKAAEFISTEIQSIEFGGLGNFDAPTFQLSIAGEENLAIGLEVGEVITTPVGVGIEKTTKAGVGAAFATGNALNLMAGQPNLEQQNKQPRSTPDEELAKRITENTRALEEMDRREITIHPNYRKLALEGKEIIEKGRKVIATVEHIGITDQEAQELRDLFWETMGGEETLEKLGLEGTTVDRRFIKHFTSPEIKTMVSRSGNVSKKLTGGHVLDVELVNNGTVAFEVTGGGELIKEGTLFCEGLQRGGKTSFPFGWIKKDTVTAVGKSIRTLAHAEKTSSLGGLETIGVFETTNGGKTIISNIGQNILVKTELDQAGRFLTSYPKT